MSWEPMANAPPKEGWYYVLIDRMNGKPEKERLRETRYWDGVHFIHGACHKLPDDADLHGWMPHAGDIQFRRPKKK